MAARRRARAVTWPTKHVLIDEKHSYETGGEESSVSSGKFLVPSVYQGRAYAMYRIGRLAVPEFAMPRCTVRVSNRIASPTEPANCKEDLEGMCAPVRALSSKSSFATLS